MRVSQPAVYLTARFDPDFRTELAAIARAVDVPWVEGERWNAAETIARLRDAEILVTEETDPVGRLDGAILNGCSSLRMIVAAKRNPEVDLVAATARSVLVVRMPGLNAGAVADLTVALMLDCARNVVPAARSLQDGIWSSSNESYFYRRFLGIGLAGRAAGLIGLGAIGREVAHRLAGFRMRVLAFDPHLSPQAVAQAGCEHADLATLLAEADFVSLHAAVTPETTGMLGPSEIGLMKPTAYLINTARAALVDEAALLAALSSGRIAGAGLDVYHHEPLPSDSPWLRLPNVVATPHIAGAVVDQIREQSQLALLAVRDFVHGACPAEALNPEAFAPR